VSRKYLRARSSAHVDSHQEPVLVGSSQAGLLPNRTVIGSAWGSSYRLAKVHLIRGVFMEVIERFRLSAVTGGYSASDAVACAAAVGATAAAASTGSVAASVSAAAAASVACASTVSGVADAVAASLSSLRPCS